MRLVVVDASTLINFGTHSHRLVLEAPAVQNRAPRGMPRTTASCMEHYHASGGTCCAAMTLRCFNSYCCGCTHDADISQTS